MDSAPVEAQAKPRKVKRSELDDDSEKPAKADAKHDKNAASKAPKQAHGPKQAHSTVTAKPKSDSKSSSSESKESKDSADKKKKEGTPRGTGDDFASKRARESADELLAEQEKALQAAKLTILEKLASAKKLKGSAAPSAADDKTAAAPTDDKAQAATAVKPASEKQGKPAGDKSSETKEKVKLHTPERDARTVFVGNLPPTITEKVRVLLTC